MLSENTAITSGLDISNSSDVTLSGKQAQIHGSVKVAGGKASISSDTVVISNQNTSAGNAAALDLSNNSVVKISSSQAQFNGSLNVVGSSVSLTADAIGITASNPSEVKAAAVSLSNGASVTLTGSDSAKSSVLITGDVAGSSDSSVSLSKQTMRLADASDVNLGKMNLTKSIVRLGEASKYTVSALSGEDANIVFQSIDADTIQVGDNQIKGLRITAAPELTEKYGSGEALLKAMNDEGTLNIKGNDVILSGEESDMTGAWTADENGNVSYVGDIRESSTLAAAKHFNAATLAQWRYENNHLSDRLGDIRYAKDLVGSWARIYGLDSKVSDTVSTKYKANTIQVGVDFPVAANWLVGAAFGYTDGEAKFRNGNADSEGYTFALYGTALFDCGAYVDVIGRLGRISSDVDVTTVLPFEASYDNTTYGLSAEVGYRWDLSKTFYVIPQAELSYGYVKGDDYTASNDIHIAQENFKTLVGRLGAQFGANFAENRGTVYLTTSVNHEFQGETEAMASRAEAADQHLNETLDGTWFSYGLGAQFNVTDSWSFYGSLTRANGSDYQENYRYSIGTYFAF